MEPQHPGLGHSEGMFKAKAGPVCSGLWMWHVDHNQKETGLVLETESNDDGLNLMLTASSFGLRWQTFSSIIKAAGGMSLCWVFRSSPFTIKFCNLHRLTSTHSPCGSTLDQSLLCVMQDPWLQEIFSGIFSIALNLLQAQALKHLSLSSSVLL